MAICKICNKEFDTPKSQWCSRRCYFKTYYEKNKDKLLKRRREWHKKNYKAHPLKKRTEEEKKEYFKKYYQEHKNYYKEKSHEYYLKHKNDKDYKERHKKALKKYLLKRKLKGDNYGN